MPIDNNQMENQIRPWALGRSNWLFAGSLRSDKRAAAIMNLIQSARMNRHDAYAHLKDVLMRLPAQRASEIDQLRSASLHWLRHTATTFDAPFRDMKDLQADLRHNNSLSTTQYTYYHSLDEQRARSIKGLKIQK